MNRDHVMNWSVDRRTVTRSVGHENETSKLNSLFERRRTCAAASDKNVPSVRDTAIAHFTTLGGFRSARSSVAFGHSESIGLIRSAIELGILFLLCRVNLGGVVASR